MAVALGRGPAGLAHRVLGDGRGRCSGVDFEIHGGGSDLVFPHHENEIAQTEAARGEPLARIWMHNGMVADRATRRWRSRSATSACCTTRSTSTAATRSSCTSSAATTASRSPSRPRRCEDARARGRARARARAAGSTPTRPRPRTSTSYAERFFDALADDFNTAGRARGAVRVGRARPTAGSTPARRVGVGRLRRDAACARAREPARRPTRRRADAEAERLLDEREAARAARDFARADAMRDELAALRLGGARHRRGRAARARAVIVYGRNPVREALRGRRAVHAGLGDRERRAASRGCAASRSRIADGRAIEELCGSPEHQGVCAEVGALPVRRRRRAARRRGRARRLPRRGPGPAQPRRRLPGGRGGRRAGVVIPERRAAEVTPAVCKASAGRGRAPAGRPGAQPRRLARRGQGAPAPGSTAPRPRRAVPVRPARLPRAGSCSCSDRRGRGLRPRVAAACDELVAAAQRGRVGSLNVSTAAAALRVRDLAFPRRRALTGLHNCVHTRRADKAGVEL